MNVVKTFVRHMRSRWVNPGWQRRDLIDRLMVPKAREALMVARTRAGLAPLSPHAPKRLLVDVSVIHKHDAGTGIQRVVRSLRDRLAAAARPGVVIEHIVLDKQAYVTTTGEIPVSGPESLFLGLDFATDAIYRARRQIHAMRRSGTPIWFLVHDVLPMSHPHWFTYPSRLKYRRWMRVCAALADGIFCVSPDVAHHVSALMTSRYRRADLPRIVTVTPGSNISPADWQIGPDQLPLAPGLDARRFAQAVLVVGTLEPRKGHADALAAFEVLWLHGHAVPLVLIGREGWDTASLQAAIRQHEQYGRLLFWFHDVSDDALHAAYRYCRLTLVPSLAEGYGLPLDEALALSAPVLARDIPVFHRHQQNRIRYFPAQATPHVLADAILAALRQDEGDRCMPTLPNWDATAHECMRALGCARPHVVPVRAAPADIPARTIDTIAT